MKIHVVRQGDTLWRLVQGYQTTINQIILGNELDNPNVLVVGQSLVIPENNREYIVQQGDSLWSIASRYGVTVQEIASYNNISDPSLIFVGQMLQMPYLLHTIQSGETLGRLPRDMG
jgi:spore germination protein